MEEFLVRIGLSFVLSFLIFAGVELFGHTIHYGIALLISLVLVFGGWLFLDSDWID